MSRIAARFEALKKQNRSAFVPFIMAGDPDGETSLRLMKALPAAGADLIELGVCFTDPMADGPAIQAAGLRALDAGQTLRKTLEMTASFREEDDHTPVILMGYYNPFLAYGVEKFLSDARAAGVDGLIIVDLPPEEDAALCQPALEAGLDFVRLATPTTDQKRLPAVLKNASGFIYYVSVAGITGQKSGDKAAVAAAVRGIQDRSGLPVAVGFGIKTVQKAGDVAKFADAVVVGSALVEEIAAEIGENGGLERPGGASDTIVNRVLSRARDLAEAVKGSRSATE